MNACKRCTPILALAVAERPAMVDQNREARFEEGRMLQSQEPKYGIRKGRIVNRRTGEAIPDDEPIFVLRAKDRLAIRALTAYSSAVEDPQHAQAVAARIEDFKRFAQEHPERLKKPNTRSERQAR